ncbi:DUF2878 domain-containing protein [Noviherbaspirillum galbum]|uniref:DUF2878 domain-containing protein n=1 Tax=Noviherbaspirillum galbum TaxID=2709383 RepID=A0A6B3SG33_9BURK|nr:DUF2878 domain-containing protein [Noviherbaspirillum galbum]NEX59563.1 DUF2878 domain-containing protein [Noviherbaspirillum galbum]
MESIAAVKPSWRNGAAINFVLFQAGWLGCVLSAARGQAWLGVLGVAAIGGWHLAHAARPRAEARLMLLAALLGIVWESVLASGGWLVYPDGLAFGILAPYWLVAMWVLFATTLNASLGWLRGKPWLAAAFGGVGGPLAFLAGERLGAVAFARPAAATIALALGWALLTPLLTAIASRLSEHRP